MLDDKTVDNKTVVVVGRSREDLGHMEHEILQSLKGGVGRVVFLEDRELEMRAPAPLPPTAALLDEMRRAMSMTQISPAGIQGFTHEMMLGPAGSKYNPTHLRHSAFARSATERNAAKRERRGRR